MTGWKKRDALDVLFMSVLLLCAMSILAQCFVAADGLSRSAYARDLALAQVQTAADILMWDDRGMDAVVDHYGEGACEFLYGHGRMLHVYLTEGMSPCTAGEADYLMSVEPVKEGGVDAFRVAVLEQDGSTEVLSVVAPAMVGIPRVPGQEGGSYEE